MSETPIHRTPSPDGTQITSYVHGQGPPLVLVPGGPADGDTGWEALLPHLTQFFTCFPVNTRGRGLSADHPDHSRQRLVEDIVAFVESIGDEVLLFGHSAGGTHALEAAASTRSVHRLALYEPTLVEFGDDDLRAEFAAVFEEIGRLTEQGRLDAAAWLFLERCALVTEQERAVLTEVGAAAAMAPLVPLVLEEQRRSGSPSLSDLALLERVSMPVLLLYGSETAPFYVEVVRALEKRLMDVESRQVPGCGHLGPEIAPDLVALDLQRLLEPVSAS